MAQLLFTIRQADTKNLEQFVLQRRLVNTNATAADFHTVQDDVISLSANLRKFLRVKQRHVLGFGSSEWMMHRVPFVFVRTPFEKRKVCDPKKIPDRRAQRSRPTMQILHLCDTQA